MDWLAVVTVLGGLNLVVVIRVAFQTGRIVQRVDDMDRRLSRVEGKVS